MSKTKKSKIEQNSNQKIVKRNWKKIGIISFIVVILLTGLGVGLYFAFRNPYQYPTKMTMLNSGSLEKRLDEEGLGKWGDDGVPDPGTPNPTEDLIAIYIGSDACPYCQSLLYGANQSDDRDKPNQSEFGIYLNTIATIKWYGFSNSKIENVKNDFTKSFCNTTANNLDKKDEILLNLPPLYEVIVPEGGGDGGEPFSYDWEDVVNGLPNRNIPFSCERYSKDDDWGMKVNSEEFGVPWILFMSNGIPFAYTIGHSGYDDNSNTSMDIEWWNQYEKTLIEFVQR